jgi:hypothetical protein
MRPLLASVISVLLLSAFCSKAQDVDGLSRDAKGRYVFTHTSMTPSATKDQMYERMKPFVVEALNASDNFVQWDESGQDSVKTVAFFELSNSSGDDIINQVVDCKARLDFREGEVTLRLSGFNYSGIVEGKTYGLPLHRLGALPYYAESFAMLSLEQSLRELVEKMDRAAAGITKNQTGKKAKR